MRAGFFLTICMLVLVACNKDDDFLNEMMNPFVLRGESIDASSMHLAFPSIAGNKDRSKILVTYREGANHISFDGKIIQMESFDKGKTWINRKVIYQPTVGGDARDPQLFLLSSGNILCRFFERMSQTKSDVRSITSKDKGGSYQSPVIFPYPYKEETYAAARGNMVVVDGLIYTVCYNRWSTSWIMKSDDEGESWQFVSWVDRTLNTEGNPFSCINEASLGYLNGTLYLVGRSYKDEGRLQIATSNDMGVTWKWDWLPARGQAPSLTPYKDSFILTYRQIDEISSKYSFVIALLKDGKLVGKPIPLFESNSFDIGYGDVLTLSNTFLVCCYQPTYAIRCYEVKYDIFK